MINKAFTLLETLVTSLIMSIVLSGSVMFIYANSRLANQTMVEIKTIDTYNTVLRSIERDVRNSVKLKFLKSDGDLIIETYDKDGIKTTWKNQINDDNSSLFRNEKEFEIPGVQHFSIKLDSEETLNKFLDHAVIDFDITVWSNNKEFSIKSGNAYSKFYLFCRNKETLID